MTDLRDRFRSLDRIPAPDLWADVVRRVEQPDAFMALQRVQVARPTAQPRPGRRPMRLAPLLLLLAGLLVTGVVGTLLVAGALPSQPAPAVLPLPTSPPENGLIAVSANPPGVGAGEYGDIYLVTEGAPARRIIGSDRDGIAQACPRFSPDGGRLAYGEAEANETEGSTRDRTPVTGRAVVVVQLDDRGDASAPIVRVVGHPEPGPIPCPEWSPDGRRLAFRMGGELWLADSASGETQVISVIPQSGFHQNELEWSRDGSLIAVAEPGQIRVVRLDGGKPTEIPVSGASPASLGWTAGDDRIVFISTDSAGDGLTVHSVNVDGSDETRLTLDRGPDVPIRYDDAAVSPDGARIAYRQRTYRCGGDGCILDSERLLVVNPHGSPEKLTAGTGVAELAIPPDFGLSGLQWSPDGERLLFGTTAGVVSVGLAPGSRAVAHSRDELNREWSSSELSWQAVHR